MMAGLEELGGTLAARKADGAPQFRLIDAFAEGLRDEDALREHARELGARAGAPFTSRSYSFPLALVAWHTVPVGCDLERIVPCDEAFAASIQTPAERAAAVCSDTDRDRSITSLWSSKEALSKALGDPLHYDPRRLEAPSAWPEGRAGRWRALSLELRGEYVAWLCWRVAGGRFSRRQAG